MHPMRIIFDAKADEFVNIFSESFPEERARVVAILNEIDQANSSKYKAITASKN
jgi:Cdc6-like AAA superfamily ATPase